MYVYTELFRPKSKQGNTTNLNISFSNEKKLLRWDSNPQHTAYEAAQLAGPIQGKDNQSNLQANSNSTLRQTRGN